jgi:AraC-like DNA-binding protein
MSPRTLQRRLQESGSSFQRVLDEARHQMERYYLSNSVLELNEVCSALKAQIHSGADFAPVKAYRRAIGVRRIGHLLLSKQVTRSGAAMENRYRAISQPPINSESWIYAPRRT